MKYLLIKDDYGAYHFVMVTEDEWKLSHAKGGWMVELFGTCSEFYKYTIEDFNMDSLNIEDFKPLSYFRKGAISS